jgi:hypothetical protein
MSNEHREQKFAIKLFTDVEWNTVKRIWKDFTYQLEKAVAYKNRSGNNDSSGEEEDHGIEKSTKCHNVLSEENPNLFEATKGGLPRRRCNFNVR